MLDSNYINAYVCGEKCGKKTDQFCKFKKLVFFTKSTAADDLAAKYGKKKKMLHQ